LVEINKLEHAKRNVFNRRWPGNRIISRMDEINKIKAKTHMILSIDEEKTFNKIQ
jgi:hypothetical protein